MLAAVYWARAPRVVLPDRALCLPTFCHSLLTVNKPLFTADMDFLSVRSPHPLCATARSGEAGYP